MKLTEVLQIVLLNTYKKYGEVILIHFWRWCKFVIITELLFSLKRMYAKEMILNRKKGLSYKKIISVRTLNYEKLC